jgi:hypothetical protein
VVAQEVKLLSNQTTQATKEFSDYIAQVQSTTKTAVDAIETIGTIINEIDRSHGQVMQAVISQVAATDDIVQSVDHASFEIRDVTENTRDTGNYTETTTVASTQMLQHSRTLAIDVQEFLLTLRRGAFDDTTSQPSEQPRVGQPALSGPGRMFAHGRFICRSSVGAPANSDFVTLTRSVVAVGGDGTVQRRTGIFLYSFCLDDAVPADYLIHRCIGVNEEK